MASPYLVYTLLDFSTAPEDGPPPATPGNVAQVVDLITRMAPEGFGERVEFLVNALSGLDGIVPIAFAGDRGAYVNALSAPIAAISDPLLRQIAHTIAKGEAGFGSIAADGLVRNHGDDVFVGGAGDDVLVSNAGSDVFVYSSGDGKDYIRDTSSSTADVDTLLLTDRLSTDVTFERIGDTLIIKTPSAADQVVVEDFFRNWGTENRGLDQIRFADGSLMDREGIRSLTTTVGWTVNSNITDVAPNFYPA